MTEPRYQIDLFWSDRDACWIANVPELQWCSAHGDTRVEAVANVREAIEGWLVVAREEGIPIPEPKPRTLDRAA